MISAVLRSQAISVYDSDQLSTNFIRKTATGLPSKSEKTMCSPSIMTVWASTRCAVIAGGLSLTRNLLSAIVNCDAKNPKAMLALLRSSEAERHLCRSGPRRPTQKP
jgi:hypothetical protein